MDGVATAVNAIGINGARATVLLVVALLLAVLLRRSGAAARHQLWAGVIVGLLLLPAASLVAPPVVLPWLAKPKPPRLPQVTLPVAAPAPWLPPVGVPVAPPVMRVAVSGEIPRVEGAPVVARPAVWVPRAVGTVWLLGAAAILLRFGRGRWRAGQLRRGTEPADPAIWPVPRGMEVREGGAVELPMTVGALRPAILVPAEEGRRWPASWRAAVIEHEAAHVRRRDPLWQALTEVTCALYWFHPLVWLAARQLRTERELAADDDVLQSGQRPSEYADLLITLGSLPAVTPTTGAVLPLLTPAGLKARLLGIIDGGRRRGVGLVGRAALAGLGCLLLVPTAGAVLVSPPVAGLFPGVVLGCVRDERAQPIAGAEVDVWDGAELAQRVFSDARGCFRWFREASHSGEVVAYARKGALAGRQAIFPGRFGTVLPATIDLRPGLSVAGTIRDEEGRPLPGTLVRVVSSERWARGPGPDAFTVARADGQFTFEGLLYGRHRLYFEGPAGGVATELVRLDEQNVTGLKVKIHRAPPITGYLVSETHHPVVGARIEDAPIYPAEAGRRLRGRHIEWDLSDGDGAFRVAFLGRTLRATGRDRSGRLVTAAFPDFERPPSPVGNPGAWDGGRPAGPQTILMRPAGLIRGSLRFPDGTPAAGAYINGLVFAEGRNTIRADLSARASADEQGRFVLGPLPIGPVELRAMTGPRSDPPYKVRGLRQPVTVTGESDPALDLTLEWQLESSLGAGF